MKHRVLFFLLIASFCGAPILKAELYSVHSTYKDGYFWTTATVRLDASDKVASQMIDDFIYQLRFDLPQLFTWALKNLKLKGESGELIQYNLKSTKDLPNEGLVVGKLDVKVPLIRTIEDFSVWTKAVKSINAEKQLQLNFDVVKADAFLKTAESTLKIVRINDKSAMCVLTTKMSFGWFFNIFITQGRYRDTAEWRFKQLLINLKTEAETRQINNNKSKAIESKPQ